MTAFLRSAQIGVIQIHPSEYGTGEDGILENGTVEVRRRVGSVQVGIGEIRAAEVRVTHDGEGKIRAPKIRADESGIAGLDIHQDGVKKACASGIGVMHDHAMELWLGPIIENGAGEIGMLQMDDVRGLYLAQITVMEIGVRHQVRGIRTIGAHRIVRRDVDGSGKRQ
jgi:hypothetical protein